MKSTKFYKDNCEEDYITTPISVLRYIDVLETERDEMFKILDVIYKSFGGGNVITFSDRDIEEIEQLIKKATL